MKLHKIFYVPGLISAILIPLLFWFYGNQKLKEPIPNAMDIGLPAKYDPKTALNEQRASFEPLRNWNYKKIVVEPSTARKNTNYYVSELKNLQQRNVKNTGIEFVLNNENSYDDFVSILNDFHIAKHEMYAVDLDKTGHLFALHFYMDPNKIEEECLLCDDMIVRYYEPTFFEKLNTQTSKLSQLPKNAFYLIFGYLFLLQISVLSLVRKYI